MFNVSHYTLKVLAALVWCSGAVVMFTKSTNMLLEAERINPDQNWIWLAIVGGLLFGGIKGRYLFKRLCLNNLKRIYALHQPKLWQFYRMRFFVFLLTMVAVGTYFSRQAHGDYQLLLTMAFIEISVATALLGSSHCFWIKKESS